MDLSGWTDMSMDWDDPNPNESCYIEAIIKAANERAMAAGNGTSLPHPFNCHDIISSNGHLDYSILSSIHSFLVSLIPYFVNHEDKSGHWGGEGRYTFAPDWTFDMVMKSIGTDAIWPNTNIYSCSEHMKGWLKQCYNIINKLKWIRRGSCLALSDWKNVYGDYETSSAAALASCESAFNAASWGGGFNFEWQSYFEINYVETDPPSYRCWHYQRRYYLSIRNEFCNYNMDAYMNLNVAAPGATFYVGLGNEEECIYPGYFNRVIKDLECVKGEQTKYPLVAAFPSSLSGATGAMGQFPNDQWAYQGIQKFDVDGGFAFKDW